MQELHIDQGFILSHDFPIAGFKMKRGGRAHHPPSDGQESMSSQLSVSQTPKVFLPSNFTPFFPLFRGEGHCRNKLNKNIFTCFVRFYTT